MACGREKIEPYRIGDAVITQLNEFDRLIIVQ